MELRIVPTLGLLLLSALILPPGLAAQADMPPGTPSDAPLLEEGVILKFRYPEGNATADAPGTYLLRGERGTLEGRQLRLEVSPLPGPEDPGESPTETSTDDPLAADYLIIDTGDPVDRNWFVPGALWGVHHLSLRDSVDRSDFETFIHRYWSPTRSDALPDSKLIFLKALSGERKGEYSYIWFIDSEETRDYYFPASQEPSRMYGEFERGWAWINDKDHLGKYLAEPEDSDFTDYVIIR